MAKKMKKFADGGMAGLGKMMGMSELTPSFGGSSGGGGSAESGLNSVNQGASTIGQALGRASEAIGGGGGGGTGQTGVGVIGGGGGGDEGPFMYKKGGAIKMPKSKISTGEKSGGKKSSW